jgi:hypothetical protein
MTAMRLCISSGTLIETNKAAADERNSGLFFPHLAAINKKRREEGYLSPSSLQCAGGVEIN